MEFYSKCLGQGCAQWGLQAIFFLALQNVLKHFINVTYHFKVNCKIIL